jgi:hypothetical protein
MPSSLYTEHLRVSNIPDLCIYINQLLSTSYNWDGFIQSALPEAVGLFRDPNRSEPIAQDGIAEATKGYHRMQQGVQSQNRRLNESSEKKEKRREQHKSYYKRKVSNETLRQKRNRLDREKDRYYRKPRSLTAAQKKKRNERAKVRYHKKKAHETPA